MFKAFKNYTFFFLFVLFASLPFFVFSVEQDLAVGAALYTEANQAMFDRDFSLAKDKFEQSAQYLPGELQADALRMADFVGKMTTEITAVQLLTALDLFGIVGEVKENDKIWHLYFSDEGDSVLHLAIEGEKDLDALVAEIGGDAFLQEQVIKNTQGYLSEKASYLPGIESKIRMWYCDKDNTTNITFENYADEAQGRQISNYFENNVQCAAVKHLSWVIIIVGALAVLIASGAGFFIFRKLLRKKLPKQQKTSQPDV